MVRQNITPNTETREFESFMDFSGGMNSEMSNEKLAPNEYVVLQNVDLSTRASARKRTGRTLVQLMASGVAQGLFPFFRSGQAAPDLIAAVSGRLYVLPNGSSTVATIAMTDGGSPWTFQTTRPIEAVQYQNTLFVATGTKLLEVVYNTGTSTFTATTTVPYTPTVQEAIYIGTNGLATNPYSYVTDQVTPTLYILGIQPASRTGTVTIDLPLTVYIGKPAGIASVDYQWEYKLSTDTAYTMGRAWTTGAGAKTYNLNVATAGTYDIRVSVRDTAVPATNNTYVLTSFTVEQITDKANTDLPYVGMQTCNKIKLHWDRILLAGDTINPTQMYVSDLQNPRYYPVTNTINFDTGKLEPINTIVQFQTYIVVMTNTTIQTLLNKDPSTYERFIIHDTIGCTSALSAKVVGNQILFQSFEGLMSLKPNPYRNDTMSVQRIDKTIHTEIPKDTNSCSLFFNNQYWLCFPTQKVIYRYYFEIGVWSKDTSTKLNIAQFFSYGGNVYNLTTDGNLLIHNDSVYSDVGIAYDMIIETKLHDLSASFNNKKLRRLYLIGRHTIAGDVNLKVKVYADAAVILTPEDGDYVTDEDGFITWQPKPLQPNFHFYTGTVIGSWIIGTSPLGSPDLSVQRASINGKCRRMKLQIVHSDAIPCEIYGFGVEFKMKKV